MAGKEQNIIFAIAGPAVGDDAAMNTIIIGIPRKAWEHMKDGKTHHLTLEKAGVPIQIVLFGGRDQDSCRNAIEQFNEQQGHATEDRSREDWGIPIDKSD